MTEKDKTSEVKVEVIEAATDQETSAALYERIMAVQKEIDGLAEVMKGTNGKHQVAVANLKAATKKRDDMLHAWANDLPWEETPLGKASKK